MSESLTFTKTENKAIVYSELIPQIKALIEGETNLIANLANVAAVLKQAFGFFWVGFYLVEKDQLVLGPFQGSIACTRIPKGKGVCGKTWDAAQTILVPDVELFEGHIACSSLSRSEIVVPIFKHSEVVAVLDVDSDKVNDLDATDVRFLEEIAAVISEWMDSNSL